MAFEISKSPIGFLVPDADLSPQPFGHDVEMAFDVVGCLAIHRSSCLASRTPRLISIVAGFRARQTRLNVASGDLTPNVASGDLTPYGSPRRLRRHRALGRRGGAEVVEGEKDGVMR
ncbi:MAG TPA: hypothetical protein VGK70_05285 [Thermoanaerobaculia bacterium]|jgi:hypothetical protein